MEDFPAAQTVNRLQVGEDGRAAINPAALEELRCASCTGFWTRSSERQHVLLVGTESDSPHIHFVHPTSNTNLQNTNHEHQKQTHTLQHVLTSDSSCPLAMIHVVKKITSGNLWNALWASQQKSSNQPGSTAFVARVSAQCPVLVSA